jgi:hypothetical protein
VSDFFGDYTTGPERDSKGQPLLITAAPIKGCYDCSDWRDHKHAYTRASYLSDFVTDPSKTGLHIWELRYLARGLGLRPDLARLAAVETYNTGLEQDPKAAENRASGKRLDDIIERAQDAAKIHEKADYGTAVHAITEPGNGNPVPLELIADVESWAEAMKGAEIVQTEVFTANDRVMAAGTFDHLAQIYLPGYGLVVLDKKTGKIKPHENLIQLATYANADIYDWATDTRRPMPEGLNRSVGIVAQIEAGKGRTRLFKADLDYGWHMAKVAAEVRDFRATRKDRMLEDLAAETVTNGGLMQVHREIEAATTREEIVGLYRRFPRLFDTTPALVNDVKARLTDLGLEIKA